MPVFNFAFRFDNKGARGVVEQLRKVSDEAGKAQHAVEGVGSGARGAGGGLKALSNDAKSVTSNIKNMAGQLLALVGAYKALGEVKSFVTRGIEFNAAIESSKIGIAAIITSMATLQDAQGHVLDGAEKYAAAQEIAAQMMKRIQVLGLQTTATTQELVQGVQTVIGPALQAGLKLEQIPDFALRAAQAMQTMGIPLQQMRTELEAVLTGNINKMQDLLAPRIGINKALIDRWKAEGTYYENVIRRLEAYKLAGEDVAQTLTGLWSNFQEALDVVSGSISEGFSGNLKESLREIQKLLISTEGGGAGIGTNFKQVALLLGEIESRLGGGVLGAVRSMISATEQFNDYLSQNGAAETLDALTWAAKTAAGAFVGLKLARAAYNSEALSNLKNEAQSLGVIQALREKIIELDGSLKQRIASEKETALAALQTAKADFEAAAAEERRLVVERDAAQSRELAARVALTEARNKKELAVSARQVRQATAREIEALREYSASTRIATDAQHRLTEARAATARAATSVSHATKTMSEAVKGASVLTVGLSGLRSAFSGIISLLGGPWGAAFTIGLGALSYFMAQEDSATEYARNHAEAMRMVSNDTQTAAWAVNEYGNKLRNMTEAERAYTQARLNNEKYQVLRGKWYEAPAQGRLASSITPLFPSAEEIRRASELTEIFKFSKAEMASSEQLKEAKEEYMEYAASIGKVDEKSILLIDTIVAWKKEQEELNNTVNLLNSPVVQIGNTVVDVAYKFNTMTQAIIAGVDALNMLQNVSQAIEPLQSLLEKSEWARFTAGLAPAKLSVANTLKQDKSFNDKKIRDLLAGNYTGYSKEDISAYETALKNYEEASRLKSSKKGASQVENARHSLEALNAEIAKLSGTGSAADLSLTKKFNEIEKLGRNAKISGKEVTDLKNRYAEAFKTDLLQRFDDELLKISGDTKAINLREVTKQMDEWRKQFNALEKEGKISPEEAEERLAKMGTALEKKHEYQDLQTAVSFYDDLANLSGNYTASIEKQNELIHLQAEIHRQNGLPPDLVGEWELLQKINAARDPWSGMSRSVRKFYADATDYAKGFEEVSTQALDGFSSQLSSTLWKGEQDFAAFFDSIGQMLMDMAIKASMAQIIGNGSSSGGGLLGLLGGALGGLFGGNGFASSPGFSVGSNAISSGAFWASAQGNVFSGGNLSDYSNSIVTQPTFFGYDRHFTAFASGAGLMGEAGPEAIVPLAHMSDGSLGFNVKGLHELMRQDREWDTRKHSGGYSEEMRQLIAQASEMRSQQMAAMPTINVTVINQAGAEVETSRRQNSDGSLDLEVMITKAVARDMSRRGGSTNQVMRNEYNLSKRPIGR